jgi:hypothetical protein
MVFITDVYMRYYNAVQASAGAFLLAMWGALVDISAGPVVAWFALLLLS